MYLISKSPALSLIDRIFSLYSILKGYNLAGLSYLTFNYDHSWMLFVFPSNSDHLINILFTPIFSTFTIQTDWNIMRGRITLRGSAHNTGCCGK